MLQGHIDQQRINSCAAAFSVVGSLLLIAALFLMQSDDVHPYVPFVMASTGSLVLGLGIAMCWYRHWRSRV